MGTIEAVYGVPEDQLRVFVHYLPQFFHFHVHFTRHVVESFLSAFARKLVCRLCVPPRHWAHVYLVKWGYLLREMKR